MTTSVSNGKESGGITQLIETLLQYAIRYAVSRAEPRDGSCWETIDWAREYLRRRASVRSSTLEQPLAGGLLLSGFEYELLTGLDEEQFSINYQPVCDIDTLAVVGVEALARWVHPKRGNIPPTEFIPTAERMDAIHALGKWIMRESCVQMVAWEQQGLVIPYLSVNVSPLQLKHAEFLTFLDEALSLSGLSPSRLFLEVTESLALHNGRETAKVFGEVCDRGVRIMVDDFGTGFSNLSYLRNLSFAAVKMDRQFVSGLPSSNNDLEIVKVIAGLTRRLGMDIIAEGVETVEQKEALIGLGCKLIQGWLVSPALPPADLLRGFREGRLVAAVDYETRDGTIV